MKKLPKAFYGRNRRLLKERTEEEVLVIPANSQVQSSYDQAYPFVQDQNFFYLTGITYPDWLLVLSGEKDFLVAPIRPPHGDLFDGAHDPARISKDSNLPVFDNAKGWAELKALLTAQPAVGTLTAPPQFIKQLGFYTNPARRQLANKLKRLVPGVTLNNIAEQIAALRVVKTDDELALLEEAVAITITALKYIPQRITKYGRERDVVTDLTHTFLKSGAEGHAYEPIVASGSRACTIHHLDLDNPVEQDRLLLLDVGARVGGYAADVSWTFPVGKPDALALDLLQGLRDLHQGLLEGYKPGVLLSQMQEEAERRIAELLRTCGVLDSAAARDVRDYFPHAISHFLGLDVHDVGDRTKPLEPGMLLTVEPGIYLREQGIGMRLEDDIVITKEGNRNLSQVLSL